MTRPPFRPESVIPFDRQHLSRIGHGAMPCWNPIAADALERLALRALPPAGGFVLDVGCGQAELLIRVIERSGARGLGIDPHAAALEHAEREAARRVPGERVTFRAERFEAATLPASAFDLVSCVGSCHAAGGYARALDVFRRLLKPRGFVLVGDGYWKQSPAPDYLAAIGATADETTPLEGQIEAAAAGGYEVVESALASPDDWSRYEDTYAANIRAFVAAHPEDPDAAGMSAHIEAWRAAYLEWGRATLGFAVHLLRAVSA
jgi:SAM-dependent methyltransferase